MVMEEAPDTENAEDDSDYEYDMTLLHLLWG